MTALSQRTVASRSGGYRRAVRLVSRWAAFYTRDLDPRLAGERRDELASDLWEQGAAADESGTSGAATERAILWRAARGIPSDLSWRRRARTGSSLEPDPFPSGWSGRGSYLVAVSVASVVLAFALLTLGRLASTAARGLPLPSFAVVASVTLGSILLICGMTLLVRLRTRWLGAAWLAVMAPAVLFFAVRGVIDVSATFQWYYDGILAFGPAQWGIFVIAFLAALALFYLALAVAWFPTRAASVAQEVGR